MELSTRKGLMIFRKRTLSRAIQLLLVTWAAQSMGAQVDAEEGQVLNFTNLEWDHSSPLVLNSEGAGASINVNGVGQFDLSDGAVLLNAANGGAIHLNGGGEINIVGGRIGKLDNAIYGAIGGGTLSLINYKISIDNSSQLDNSPILALNTSENNQLSQLRVNYIGKGEFLKVSGAQATLTDNNIEVNDSNGAMVLTSQTVSSQTTASNVTINGGYYYGSNNIDYLRDTTSTGATIDVGGDLA